MILKRFFLRALIFAGFVLSIQALQAQTQGAVQGPVVRGKVTEKGTGKPIPGVNVTERNRDRRLVNGVITDQNGNYQISIADKNDSLHFAMIGMKTIARAIRGEVINVVLEDNANSLNSVDVVARRSSNMGGFLNVDPKNSTAAVSRVNMDDLKDVPANTVDAMLEGKASGLLISMNDGNPGSGSSIQIRGAASLGLNSKPLIVVDDVPFRTPVGNDVDVSSPEGLSELVSISPADIASIEILKDAAATALYGSDGANGVIVIKTKRGDNVAPSINVTSTTQVKLPQRPIPLLNGDEYKTMMLEGYQNRYGTNGIDLTTSTIGKLFLSSGAVDFENYNNNTYWPGVINLSSGFSQNTTAGIMGGGEVTKYNISVGYADETGPIINTNFKRLTGRFNFDYKISDRLQFSSNFSYSHENKASSYDNVGDNVLKKSPVLPVFTQDQYGNPLPTYFVPGSAGFQNDIRNPVAVVNDAINKSTGDRLDAAVMLRYNPIKGVRITSSIANSYAGNRADKFLPLTASGVDYFRQTNSYLKIDNNANLGSIIPQNFSRLYIKNDLVYTLEKGKHTLQSLLSSIIVSENTTSITIEGANGPSELLTSSYSTDRINNLRSAKSILHSSTLVGQFIYSYQSKYSVSGSLNREGNSAFGKNNRHGVFPAFSGYWRPSDEKFMEGTKKWLSDWKFRGSWGIAGRGPRGSGSNALTYSANAAFADIQGVVPNNIELVNLRWEKTTTLNIGMDFSFFNGRLSSTTEWSRIKTKDMLLSQPISGTSGFESVTTNFGDMSGNIFEQEITGVPIRTKNWRLTTSFNISSAQTKITALPRNLPVVSSTSFDNGSYMSLVNVGNYIGTVYGLRYRGVFSRDEDAFVKDNNGQYVTDFTNQKIPLRWLNSQGEIFTGGDASYADLNNDGIINKQDVTAIGNSTPKFFGGIVFRLSFKAWELSSTATYRYGFDIINMAQMNTTNMFNNNNQSTAVMRRWRKQGDVTDIPRALNGAGHNWVGSDRFVEDGSYLRINSLSFSYNLPKNLLSKLSLRSARLTLTTTNPYTLTRYSGVDPTVGLNGNDPFSMGKDLSLTPSPLTYALGAWITF